MTGTKRRVRPSQMAIWVALTAVTGLVFLPLVWALKAVFTPTGEIFSTGLLAAPSHFTLDNLTRGLSSAPFGVYFRNSFELAIAVTIAIVITSTLAGYGFAKFTFRGNSFLFTLVIMAMLMPFQAILIPLFVEVTRFGWIDSMKGLILPGSVSAFGIFMMRQFMGNGFTAPQLRIKGEGNVRIADIDMDTRTLGMVAVPIKVGNILVVIILLGEHDHDMQAIVVAPGHLAQGIADG